MTSGNWRGKHNSLSEEEEEEKEKEESNLINLKR